MGHGSRRAYSRAPVSEVGYANRHRHGARPSSSLDRRVGVHTSPYDGADPPALIALRRWLDTWAGVGHIVTGMACHGYDLALTSDEQGWGAPFLHRDHLIRPWVGQVLRWWTTRGRPSRKAAWQALSAPPLRDLALTEESTR